MMRRLAWRSSTSRNHAEATVSPDRIADDLVRKTIAGVRRPITLHGPRVSVFEPKLVKPKSPTRQRLSKMIMS